MKALCLVLCLLFGLARVEGGVVRQLQLNPDCPVACFLLFAPVCGSDGHTYSNTCQLQATACRSRIEVTVAHSGPCDDGRFDFPGLVQVN